MNGIKLLSGTAKSTVSVRSVHGLFLQATHFGLLEGDDDVKKNSISNQVRPKLLAMGPVSETY